MRLLLMLLYPFAVLASGADVTITGNCGGNWAWNPSTNVLSCGTVPPTPSPQPTPTNCAGFSGTIFQSLPWAADAVTPDTSGLQKGVAYVVKVSVPVDASSASAAGRLTSYEHPDAPHMRWTTLSTVACAWEKPNGQNAQYTTGANYFFRIGAEDLHEQFPVLQPGRSYYLNIRMDDPAAPNPQKGCGTTTCNMRSEINAPR